MATTLELQILSILTGALEAFKGKDVDGGRIRSVSMDNDNDSGEVIVEVYDVETKTDRTLLIGTEQIKDITTTH
jgi:hypothetical protein